MNTIKFQTVANFIKAQAEKGQFSIDTAQRLRNGEIVLKDNTEYIRKEITIGGTIDLIDANTLQNNGISSFKSNKFDKYVNQVITSLRLGYASNAASGKEADLMYNYYQSTIPAAVLNADLVIEQDGKPVVKVPVADLAIMDSGARGYAELSGFALLKEEQTFSMKLVFAAGATIAGTDKHYVEVSVKGMATSQR